MEEPYIIAGHIRRDLRAITEHYNAAGDPPKIVDDSEPRGGDLARPPTDVHAIDVRAEAIRDVSYYVQFILDEVNDGTIETKMNGADLHQMATFIDRWALALAEQHPDDALTCRGDMGTHARRLKTVAHGTRTRRIEVGPCPEIDMVLDEQSGLEELVRCDGTVVANLTERDPDKDDDGLLPQHLTCTTDRGHSWQPWQWHDIGKRIERMSA